MKKQPRKPSKWLKPVVPVIPEAIIWMVAGAVILALGVMLGMAAERAGQQNSSEPEEDLTDWNGDQ